MTKWIITINLIVLWKFLESDLNANNKPVSPSLSKCGKEENNGSGAEKLPTKKGSLRTGLYFYPEEAQFSPKESCESPFDERN